MKASVNRRIQQCTHRGKSLTTQAGVLVLGLCLAASQGVGATYQVLHTFTGSDGKYPSAEPTVVDATLYGTTAQGGDYDGGTLFKVNADGSGYTLLKSWLLWDNECLPHGAVLVSGTIIYGTTSGWFPIDKYGSVFKVNTDGSSYTALRQFARNDGAAPSGNLILLGSTVYGTTQNGGISNCGTVFQVNTDGSGFLVLKHFTRADGYYPSGLALSGTTLYGSAGGGGTFDKGVIYRLQTDGSGFTVIKHFSGSDGSWAGPLLISDTTLYGTSSGGGAFDKGTIFKVGTDGGGFQVLKSFSGLDGDSPNSPLILAGTTLLGTTYTGGSSHNGNVFMINTDGTGFTVLKEFHGSDGAYPEGLALSGSTLYGVTDQGGYTNSGVLFAISLAQLHILRQSPSQTAEIGRSVSLDVEAEGVDPLRYQWYFNETNMLSGCTNRALLCTNLQPSNAGAYKVVVTDRLGQTTNALTMLQVISPMERRPVPAIQFTAEPGSAFNVEYADAIGSAGPWTILDTVISVGTPQYYFDLSASLPPQRFYRTSQPMPSGPAPLLNLPGMVTAITLTGTPGNSVRVDGINQFGPTDAWFTLDTVTLTNTSQLYFDVNSISQPPRLYRVVPLP